VIKKCRGSVSYVDQDLGIRRELQDVVHPGFEQVEQLLQRQALFVADKKGYIV